MTEKKDDLWPETQFITNLLMAYMFKSLTFNMFQEVYLSLWLADLSSCKILQRLDGKWPYSYLFYGAAAQYEINSEAHKVLGVLA